MLFAAGLGTRMGELVAKMPKPLIPVAGIALIDRAMRLITEADIAATVVNVGHLSDMLIAHLHGSGALIKDESDRLLETGGGLRNALDLLGDDPVFTLNSDAAWVGPNPLVQLKHAWDPRLMDGLLLLCDPVGAGAHQGSGDFVFDQNGKVIRGPGLIYTGAQIIKTDDLSAINQDKFSLNLVWDKMMERGRLCAVVYDGQWCDVGTPTGLAEAEKLLQAPTDV
jgi:N-acetyl-alpha-D-muramate 1-phosphate uridylyltransferase